jgi:tripartite-type tricarboxylate transporter receptor subunit TctC
MNRVLIPLMLVLAVLGLAIAAPSQAAAGTKVDWPEKGRPVTIIVPFPAGGGADIAARAHATMLERDLGTPVMITNKPGAGAQVGNTFVSLAKPDGYTIGWCPPQVLIPGYVNPERQAVYARKSFQPIAVTARAPCPLKTLQDLVDAAKAKSGQMKAGVGNLLAGSHLVLLTLNKALGVDFATVHFDGAAPLMTTLLGGHVDLAINQTPEFLSQVRAGQVRVLAVVDERGSKFLPDVKTMGGWGHRLPNQAFMGQYQTAFAPAGTPMGIVEILVKSLKGSLNNAEMQKKLDGLFFEPVFMDATETAKFWEEMEGDITKIFKDMGKL